MSNTMDELTDWTVWADKVVGYRTAASKSAALLCTYP
jgi:hypothetical protein